MMIDTFDVLAQHLGCGCGCTPYAVGRALYTYNDCGPWIVFLVESKPEEHREVYYESEEARTRDSVRRIAGIKIGSIVEGSDVEIEPRTLMFPFTSEALDTAVSGIDDEAAFYWLRDNSDWFTLRSPHGKPYTFRVTQFESDPAWCGAKPRSKKILKRVKDFCAQTYPRIWKKVDVGMIRQIEPLELVPFMDTNWQVMEWLNDSTYQS